MLKQVATIVAADSAGIAIAGAALREGRNVAFPTETVYGLGGNALDIKAVNQIFTFKGRPLTDPLIVHVHSTDDARPLVKMSPKCALVFDILSSAFWPGPLTMVLEANLDVIPNLVCAGTGYVGIRVPAHPVARALLLEAKVPVAAPSANRFGHVSPTCAQHVVDDLGSKDILVIESGLDGSCAIGIESTVLKISDGDELVLFRKGGVSETSILKVLSDHGMGQVRIVPPAALVTSETDSAVEAPGQALTHYAPDVDTWLVDSIEIQSDSAGTITLDPCTSVPLNECVVIDFMSNLLPIKHLVLEYRDLSSEGSAAVAANKLFGLLRWTETTSGKHVLIQNVSSMKDPDAPAVSDRMFRAASGKIAKKALVY